MTKAETNEFKKNIALFTKASYDIEKFPPGVPAFTHKWNAEYADSNLLFLRYFKKKFGLKGARFGSLKTEMTRLAVEKNVRITTVYTGFRFVDKRVVQAKFDHELGSLPTIFQYRNKFLPLTREDTHLIAVQLLMGLRMFKGRVIDLSTLTSDDLSGLIPAKKEARVFKFLGVPDGEPEIKRDLEGKPINKNDPGVLDLFRNKSDEDSAFISFENPQAADASIKSLSNKSLAHQVRASLLAIQRAKATLKNTKDPEKKKRINAALKKFVQYKNKKVAED